jgi:hypothetical protein
MVLTQYLAQLLLLAEGLEQEDKQMAETVVLEVALVITELVVLVTLQPHPLMVVMAHLLLQGKEITVEAALAALTMELAVVEALVPQEAIQTVHLERTVVTEPHRLFLAHL